ncbi:MAG: glycosyltransferase, partial [Lachnospiraceae bacterium]|nr:glycosyltransferase [Lachnospiraceae bacterium]
LKEAQCLIHPSFYAEGMSNVCLEAAASARPVITTDHPGCRDTIIDQETGFLIAPQDEASLEKAVQKFLSLDYEQKKQMGLKGRAYMERHFDRQKVIEKYMQEIHKICKA